MIICVWLGDRCGWVFKYVHDQIPHGVHGLCMVHWLTVWSVPYPDIDFSTATSSNVRVLGAGEFSRRSSDIGSLLCFPRSSEISACYRTRYGQLLSTPYSSTFTEPRWNIGLAPCLGRRGVSVRTEFNSMTLNVAFLLPSPC